MTVAQFQRRICWPNPDATCLEGGCIYCNDNRFKDFSTIENYVKRAGILPNRGIGEKEAMVAWIYGLDHQFFNVEIREKPTK